MDITKNPVASFPKDSAGSLMTRQVPIVSPENTIRTVEEYLLKNVKNLESINYVYVLSKSGLLKGAMSIKEIFRQPKNRSVAEVMIKDLVTAHPHTDQERVAYLALKSNIKAMPVVDKDNKFLGAVLSDVILDSLYRETQEDILHLAGVSHHGSSGFDDVLKLSIFKSLKHRLPWLLLGLLGGLLSAKIIGGFESTLEKNIVLAAFIPLIVYMADAVGTQMEAFIIRDLAIHQKLKFWQYFFTQMHIVALIALISSFSLGALAFFIYHNPALSLVLAIALFVAILSSVVTGLIVPYLFGKLKFDPANASGPVATIIQDILSVVVYFMVASWLL